MHTEQEKARIIARARERWEEERRVREALAAAGVRLRVHEPDSGDSDVWLSIEIDGVLVIPEFTLNGTFDMFDEQEPFEPPDVYTWAEHREAELRRTRDLRPGAAARVYGDPFIPEPETFTAGALIEIDDSGARVVIMRGTERVFTCDLPDIGPDDIVEFGDQRFEFGKRYMGRAKFITHDGETRLILRDFAEIPE